ncbi:MAG: MaoC/PaaZ C-terminal domain-containing protein [Hyphomonadaceae bacterium]
MPIAYPEILKLENKGQKFHYSEKEVMLYALGIGMGADPMDRKELEYVYGPVLKVAPTFASVMAWGANPGATNVNYLMVVDGERAIEFHQPLPTSADLLADSRITGVFDKGPGKGAVVQSETVIKTARGDKLATIQQSIFARGDGGFGGPSSGQPEPHPTPTRAPDQSVDIPTRPDQALIYRLSGDFNPLHADLDIAEKAGFPRPILHGMCTYGLTGRAVLQTYAGYDSTRFKSHAARFSSPVFPGETVTVDLWKDGNIISFEARVKARNATVIKNGKTELS